MSIQNLIIYKFTSLYHILKELSLDLNFKIFFIDSEGSLNDKVKNLNNYLIIVNKRYSNIEKQISDAALKFKKDVVKSKFPTKKHSY